MRSICSMRTRCRSRRKMRKKKMMKTRWQSSVRAISWAPTITMKRRVRLTLVASIQIKNSLNRISTLDNAKPSSICRVMSRMPPIPTNLMRRKKMSRRKTTLIVVRMFKISIQIDCGNFRTDCSEMM